MYNCVAYPVSAWQAAGVLYVHRSFRREALLASEPSLKLYSKQVVFISRF